MPVDVHIELWSIEILIERRCFLFSIASCFFLISGCALDDNAPNEERNALTHGNVQLHLKVGQTTQSEVIDVFGGPDIATIDGKGMEVWTYRRTASVSRSVDSGGGFFLLLGGYSRNKSSSERTDRRMTLIIKFNSSKIVSDFKSRTSSF